MDDDGDYRQQQEAEAERWWACLHAIQECIAKDVSEESLATLRFECGISFFAPSRLPKRDTQTLDLGL